MWPFTENELNNFFGDVIRNVARALKVGNPDWQSAAELRDQIKALNPAVADLLDGFIAAYTEWYGANFDENGWGKRNGELENLDTRKLQANRDDKRNELLKALGIKP